MRGEEGGEGEVGRGGEARGLGAVSAGEVRYIGEIEAGGSMGEDKAEALRKVRPFSEPIRVQIMRVDIVTAVERAVWGVARS